MTSVYKIAWGFHRCTSAKMMEAFEVRRLEGGRTNYLPLSLVSHSSNSHGCHTQTTLIPPGCLA